MPNQRYKEFLRKHTTEDIVNKMAEDAPANAVGTGANVALPPTHEPGVKKKKKKDVVIGTLKRYVKENNDNNNVILKQILDTIDKVEMKIDNKDNETDIKLVKEQPKKSFKEKYKLGEYGNANFVGVGGFSIGSLDSFKPIADLGDGPPKGLGSRDSRAMGLVAQKKNIKQKKIKQKKD
tara:strand:+ start:399 stop:935 length:537 start_codon:yes stop_codon:yes gene_type:complete